MILQAVLGVSDIAVRQRLRTIFDSLITPVSSFATVVPALTRRSRWNPLSAPYWRLLDELDALLFEHIAATRSDARLREREDILAMMVLASDEGGGDAQRRGVARRIGDPDRGGA